MSKKAIILVMSCNQERFINEEHIIRKTWGKDIIDGKYNNIELIFYRGNSDSIYLEDDVLHLISDDTLWGSYIKTIDCFKYLVENKDFDYIIRANTSTYINVEAILQFLNLENINEEKIFGSRLIFNNGSEYLVPYLGGHFLIIPKSIINILMANRYKYNIEGIDDCCIGLSLAFHYNNDYTKHIGEIDTIRNIKEPYLDRLSTAYCVRVKDDNNLENNIINMIGFHYLYKNVKTKINPPHNFTEIETLWGKIQI